MAIPHIRQGALVWVLVASLPGTRVLGEAKLRREIHSLHSLRD